MSGGSEISLTFGNVCDVNVSASADAQELDFQMEENKEEAMKMITVEEMEAKKAMQNQETLSR